MTTSKAGEHARGTVRGLAPMLTVGLLTVAVASSGSPQAQAFQSEWVEGHHNKVRLVAAQEPSAEGAAENGNWIVGVQIRLDRTWKTYWRMPGDAGVPPSFDWAGSQNLAPPEILYPAPRRFKDAYGTVIGYANEVVFPARVVPVVAGEAMVVKLSIQYGVCKDICVFANADLSLRLGSADRSSPHWPLIKGALDQVPVPVAVAGPEYPRLVSAEAEYNSGQKRLVFDASFPSGTANADLFLITPEDLYLPIAKPYGSEDGDRKRFAVDLERVDDLRALRKTSIGIVLTDGRHAVETDWTVPLTLGDAGETPAAKLDRNN